MNAYVERDRRQLQEKCKRVLEQYRVDEFLKSADGMEMTFEAAFANLADSYLADKAPMLVRYKIGFQLLEKNDENTRAFGIAGYKVGKRWLFVPIFFLNGELKGQDMMYLRDEDHLLPLDDKWVSEVLQDKSPVFGEGKSRFSHMKGVAPPDLNVFKDNPYNRGSQIKYGKYHTDLLPGIAGIVKAAHSAPETNSFTLVDFLKEAGEAVAELFCDWYRTYPEIHHGFNRFHGADKIDEIAQHYHQKKTARFLENVLPVGRPQLEVLPVQTLDDRLKKVTHPGSNQYSEIRVMDKRAAENLNSLLEISEDAMFSTPSCTGVYDVLMKRGETQECLVLFNPESGSKDQLCTVIALHEDKKPFVNADPNMVFIARGLEKADLSQATSRYQKWFEEFEGDQLRTQNDIFGDDYRETDWCYVMLSKGRESVAPFYCQRAHPGEQFRDFDVHFRLWKKYRSPYSLPTRSACCCSSTGNGVDRIILTDREGELHIVNDELIVPKHFKTLRISDNHTGDFKIGSESDLWSTLMNQYRVLKVAHERNRYRLSDDRGRLLAESHTKAGIWNYLITRCHLPEKQARDIEVGKRYLLKTANNLLQELSAVTPAFPEPNFSSSFAGIVPEQQYQEQTSPIQMPPGAEILAKFQPDQSAIAMAQGAQQMGVQDLFDSSMMGSIVRAVRDESVIDRNLKSVYETINTLGRIRLGLYWHQDQFEDRYGKQELPELEEQLKSNFHSLGDLYLFMKTKDINPILFNFSPSLEKQE